MLRIECLGCHTSGYADCGCPEVGHNPMATMAHHPVCAMADLGAVVVCPPGSDCCDGSEHPGLSHDQQAMACTQGHTGSCAEAPGDCKVWHNATADYRHPLYEGEPPGDCPGGHCGVGVDGCTVCRPVHIEVMPGTVAIKAAAN